MFTVLIGFISHANAETELEEKAKVLSVLKKYSETVACSTSFEEQGSLEPFLKDVYSIERDPEFGQATYYVLWSGDMGCAGGSGTSSFFISEITRDTSSRPFLVKNNEAFGDDFSKKVNPRFIESVKKINPDHFIVTSSEHAKDDANNFPSMKYQYVLQRQNWLWKVTSRNLLK
jgi:hypothetical protein